MWPTHILDMFTFDLRPRISSTAFLLIDLCEHGAGVFPHLVNSVRCTKKVCGHVLIAPVVSGQPTLWWLHRKWAAYYALSCALTLTSFITKLLILIINSNLLLLVVYLFSPILSIHVACIETWPWFEISVVWKNLRGPSGQLVSSHGPVFLSNIRELSVCVLWVISLWGQWLKEKNVHYNNEVGFQNGKRSGDGQRRWVCSKVWYRKNCGSFIFYHNVKKEKRGHKFIAVAVHKPYGNLHFENLL